MAWHAGSPPSSLPSLSPAAPSPSPSPSPQQLSLQLRYDFARLVDKDPDARRSAMDSLKAFVEGELDSKSMPCFLEQVSGESGRGEPQSHTFAISLFVEVARVHKQMTVPYIPRIMATVVRSLSSGAGAHNLHHACAKVVAAVARYALEPLASSPVQCEEVFGGLCQPLLSVLASKLEPVATGSATCLQALVESEKWRLAPPGLVNDTCYRAAAALGERGTQTVAHMHLVRSLARFNPRALQEYGPQLLKTGSEIMTAARSSGSGGGTGTPIRAGTGGRGSWQQRAAAAQLLGTLLGSLDQRVLASGLLQTIEALEQCRLDKVTVVRQAVGEALATAKSLTSQVDPLLLKRERPNGTALPLSSPSSRVPSDARRRGTRRKSLWRADEFSASSESKDHLCTLPGSQESQLMSHGSPPTISSSPLLDSPSPPSSASSNNRIGRFPLYPAKQSPALMPSSIDLYTSESEWEFILARLKSPESKENTPLVGNKMEPLLSAKAVDLSTNNSKIPKENEGHFETVGFSDSLDHNMQQEEISLMSEDCMESSQQDSATHSDLNYLRDKDRNDDDHGGGASYIESSQVCNTVEGKTYGTMHGEQSIDQQEHCDEEMTSTRYNSLAHMVNLEDVVSPQVTKTRMTTEDFLIFGTPRRLVRSLQSVSSTPDSKCTSEQDAKDRIGMDIETLSESGWSVRDNPMAGESEEDSPRESLLSLTGNEDAMSRSWDGTCLKGSVSECSVVTQVDELPSALASTDISGSVLGAPLRCRQLFGGDEPDEDRPDQLEQVDKSSFSECAGVVSVQNVSTTSLSTQAAELERKLPLGWLRSPGAKVGALSSSKWDRIHRLIELFLSLTLVVVLVFPIAIATLNCLNGQSDLHVLVPT